MAREVPQPRWHAGGLRGGVILRGDQSGSIAVNTERGVARDACSAWRFAVDTGHYCDTSGSWRLSLCVVGHTIRRPPHCVLQRLNPDGAAVSCPEVTVVVPRPVVVTVAEVGIQGPPGPAGTAILQRVAAQALSAHRVMRSVDASLVDYCDNATISHGTTLLGISTNAAASGAAIGVLTSGVMSEPSWALTPGLPIFCGANGTLTQVYTPGAWVRTVGYAESATSIVIQISQPIITP